jgi:eukaryotic-like serine/threonine-protein kinase
MNSGHWHHIEALYRAVRERKPEERNAFLEGACGGDADLRQQVEALLQQDSAGPAQDMHAQTLATQTLVIQSQSTQPPSTQAILGPGGNLGPYRIEAPIGAGGMGEVFRATDMRLRRTVAIKILPRDKVADPERKKRFLQEARAASALNHPNIVTLHDIASDWGVDYLVMEYVRGKTLKELIPSHGLPFQDVCAYGKQVAGALAAAHAARVIHRDVKPANIMVTPEGHVKVLDFGLAKLAGPAGASDAPTVVDETTPGVVVGTVSYMSPEQTRGEPLDARSDIFSLGSVLYQVATGKMPFRGPSILAIMHEITSADPPAPGEIQPGMSRRLDEVILKCLRKDPAQRFQTMAEIVAALREAESAAQPGQVRIAAPLPSIAVLPFANMSTDPDNEHFGDGLAEELINALSGIEDLRVTARTSAFALRGRALDVREIGRKLDVGVVLEGSVRRSGNRLRVTAQLIHVEDGYHLWSERYDREMTDVFEIQDEISRTIVDKLRPRLSGKTVAPVLERHTEDPEAYSLYLKGRYYWEKRPAGTNRAIECFEKAIERDPKYALAYTGLADAYNTLASWEGGILPPGEGFGKGIAYAEKALLLNPDLAEGHAALAYALLHYKWDISEAERRFLDAIRLSPHYGPAHHWYSHLLVVVGRLEESLSESIAYLRADPADQFSLVHMSWHYLMAHDFDKALAESRRALQDEPNFAWHHVFHGWALLNSEAPAEAEVEILRGAELADWPSVLLSSLAHAQAIAGHREDALRSLARLTEMSKNKYVSAYEIGLIHNALGNTDEAFRQWEYAYEERSPWLIYLAREPRLRNLHGQPRFDAFLDKVLRKIESASPL